MREKALLSSIAIAALIIAGCGKRDEATVEKPYAAIKGDVSITIIEAGTVDAIKTVEIKPQVTGRIVQLLVEEGTRVTSGQLIATIDPQPTELQLEQNMAQLAGAQSQIERTSLEIAQRRRTAQATVNQAQARVSQLELELKNTPALLKVEVDSANAALASALQDRDRLTKNSQPTQRVSAKSSLDEARQNFTNATQELTRQQELEAKGFVSTRAVQSAELAVELAKARLTNATETYNRIEAGFTVEINRAEEAIKTAQANLNRARTNRFQIENKRQDLVSAKAALETARAGLGDPAILEKTRVQSTASATQLKSVIRETQRMLRETAVRTPISGIVTKKLLQVGENATGLGQFGSGSTIVKIEDRTQMRVNLAVNEIDVARLKIGMKAEVAVDALVGKKLTGTISKIAPAKQALEGQAVLVGTDSVVKYEVEIILDQGDEGLKSGMSAKCTMRVSEQKNTLFLPAEYLEKKDDVYYVYAPAANPKDPKSKSEKRKVTVGLVSSSRIQILSGVKEGDMLVKPPFTGPDIKGFMQMGPDNEEEAPKEGEKK